jgi:hypothetical protein
MAYATDLAGDATTEAEVPLVKLVGAVLGVLLVVAALRAMFGKRK